MPDQTATPPPAYFLSLSLENVRSFGQKQTISFATAEGRPAQWTIILGDNGVGKTTVLKSLAALMPWKEQKFNDDISWIPLFEKLMNDWRPIRGLGDKTLTIGYKAHVGFFDEINSYNNPERGHSLLAAIDIIGKNDLHKHGYSSGYSTLPNSLIALRGYGYGAGRTTGNSTLSEAPETTDTCASLFNDRADLLNPEEWLLFADYTMARDKDQLTTQNFNLLKTALLEVMTEGEVTDMEVSPVALGGGSPRQGVRFKTPYGWVRLKDMSLGYQTLVVWLTDFASKLFIRYPQSKNPLREPAIVLIDEIDLHLHPSWQRKLIKSLSDIFKNTQFIATAHSPLVVQAATDAQANVVLLKREGNETIVYQNPEDVRGWRVDQILTSSFFNLETARSVETEKKLSRQATLLSQGKLTARQRKELDELTLELEGQSMGSSSPDAEHEEEEMLRELTRRVGKRPKSERRA